MNTKAHSEEEQITRVVVRMNATMMGLILGTLLGIALFIATNFLILKGGPDPGPHLSLLCQFFPGYTVTFIGSLIGFAYAFATGFIGGAFLGAVYNRLAK